jgi:hypothetical protein
MVGLYDLHSDKEKNKMERGITETHITEWFTISREDVEEHLDRKLSDDEWESFYDKVNDTIDIEEIMYTILDKVDMDDL